MGSTKRPNGYKNKPPTRRRRKAQIKQKTRRQRTRLDEVTTVAEAGTSESQGVGLLQGKCFLRVCLEPLGRGLLRRGVCSKLKCISYTPCHMPDRIGPLAYAHWVWLLVADLASKYDIVPGEGFPHSGFSLSPPL
jgi:hypothetical protein